MIKNLIFWDENDDILCSYQLDSNTCIGTNEETARAVDFSFRKIDFDSESKTQISRCSTDAGDSGVGLGVASFLEKYNRCIIDDNFFSVTCTLHALSLQLASPVKKYMGEGRVEKLTLLQILHTCYAL